VALAVGAGGGGGGGACGAGSSPPHAAKAKTVAKLATTRVDRIMGLLPGDT